MNHFLSFPPINNRSLKNGFPGVPGVPGYITVTFVHLIKPRSFNQLRLVNFPKLAMQFCNSSFCSRLYILNNAQIMIQCDFVIRLMKNPNSNVTSSRKSILIPSLECTSLGLLALTLLACSLSLPPHCKPFLSRHNQLSSFPPLLTGQA